MGNYTSGKIFDSGGLYSDKTVPPPAGLLPNVIRGGGDGVMTDGAVWDWHNMLWWIYCDGDDEHVSMAADLISRWKNLSAGTIVLLYQNIKAITDSVVGSDRMFEMVGATDMIYALWDFSANEMRLQYDIGGGVVGIAESTYGLSADPHVGFFTFGAKGLQIMVDDQGIVESDAGLTGTPVDVTQINIGRNAGSGSWHGWLYPLAFMNYQIPEINSQRLASRILLEVA